MEYQTVVHNQPSNPHNTPNAISQNNITRGGTLMALRRIFEGWRRGNSIRPQLQNETCCIWLEEFKNDQVFIQLKWDKQHWFHIICIAEWTKNNTTWPIWRANYIEVAKEENRRLFDNDSLSIHSISNEERP